MAGAGVLPCPRLVNLINSGLINNGDGNSLGEFDIHGVVAMDLHLVSRFTFSPAFRGFLPFIRTRALRINFWAWLLERASFFCATKKTSILEFSLLGVTINSEIIGNLPL